MTEAEALLKGIEAAAAALEKQIPKKPLQVENSIEYNCPGCGARMDRTGTAPDRWFKRIKQGDSRIAERGMPRHFQIIETKVLGSLAGTLGWRFMWGEEKYGEFIEIESEHIPTKKEIDFLLTKAFDTLKTLMIWEIEGEENGNV